MNIRNLWCALWAGLTLASTAVSAADLVVIVSARAPVTALRADQVADIFMAESSRFPDGSDVLAIDQDPGSALRDEFYSKVARRSPALMKAYWTKMIFTGRGEPPREVAGNLAVRRLVAENPGLIGYIERSALDASVKTVLVVR